MIFQSVMSYLFALYDLREDQARKMMDYIITGEADDVQIAAYLTGLRLRGETNDTILGSCLSLRHHCAGSDPGVMHLTDICGTGRASSGTCNISAISAIVAAGAGVPVAMHCNKDVSVETSNADFLTELGVSINIKPAEAADYLQKNGIVFLLTQIYHPGLAHAASARESLEFRTLFDFLSPLNNPLNARRQVLGLNYQFLVDKVAMIMKKLGSEHIMVVCSRDETDEISLSTETRVCELKDGKISEYFIKPEDYGFRKVYDHELIDRGARRNAEICLSVLEGTKGAPRDAVLLNSGAAIYVSGLAEDFKEGIRKAEKSIDSKAASHVLEKLRQHGRN